MEGNHWPYLDKEWNGMERERGRQGTSEPNLKPQMTGQDHIHIYTSEKTQLHPPPTPESYPERCNSQQIELKIMFHNCYHTICCNGTKYLYSYSTLSCSPKGLDFKMLLDPFKKSSTCQRVVKQSNLFSRYFKLR